jgi:K+-transporting ATPase ATPase A chain
MGNMLVNAIWGGIGCGLQQFLVYLLLAVFLAGLMTGRTPELFGRKIERRGALLAVLVLLQPLVLLGFTALTLACRRSPATPTPASTASARCSTSTPRPSPTTARASRAWATRPTGGTSAARWCWRWAAIPALIIPLAIAAPLARKRAAPEGAGSLQIETPTFALTLIAVIVILTVLQFMPALVLGPVADHLSLRCALRNHMSTHESNPSALPLPPAPHRNALLDAAGLRGTRDPRCLPQARAAHMLKSPVMASCWPARCSPR